jgi:hypothetical protein
MKRYKLSTGLWEVNEKVSYKDIQLKIKNDTILMLSKIK